MTPRAKAVGSAKTPEEQPPRTRRRAGKQRGSTGGEGEEGG
eukprot:CAMPEP_0185304546 /NCGR_PEP_ID=MMETSP1363-20130426/14826_1 /TAXON_ID=38817 /ORGANISM="Gephyrocapsa oceanica, Strain RCC1303" /LENGTH=40 /DNA_ID= /DNA_START= /DNA_END= /DNA_ORIENTATION=